MSNTFRCFISDFTRYSGVRGVYALALSLAAALTEGIGFLAIVPILKIVTGDTSSSMFVDVLETISRHGLTTPFQHTCVFLLAFLLLLLVRSILVWWRTVTLAALSLGYVDHWRLNVFSSIASSDWTEILEMRRHDIQQTLLNDVSRLSGGVSQFISGMVAICFITVQLSISLIISPSLTLLIVVILMSGLFLLPVALKRAHLLGRRQTLAGRQMHETLGHFIDALKLIKVQREELRYQRKFEERTDSLRSEILKFTSNQSTVLALLQFLTALLLCSTVLIGLFVFETPTANLIAIVLILTRLSGPVFSIFNGIQYVANMLPAFDSIRRYSNNRLSDYEIPQLSTEADMFSSLGVRFNNVSFYYPEQSQPQVMDLSFHIRGGELVALTGPSGAGKTTILELMSGLLAPTTGRIGHYLENDKSGVSRDSVSSHIGYVPQDGFLFDISLLDNLRIASDDVSESTITSVLEITGANVVVDGLPDGLDTRAGNRGQNLSGGERQRFCIARALIGKPGLLILDEATSALDMESEMNLLDNLVALSPRPTIIVVTHRKIDQFIFDRILEV